MQFIKDTNHTTDMSYMAGGSFIDRIIHVEGSQYVIRYYGARSVSDYAPHVLKSVKRRIAEGIWDGLCGHKPTGRAFRWAVVAAPAEIAEQIHYERFDPEFSAMMQAQVDELLATIAAEERVS